MLLSKKYLILLALSSIVQAGDADLKRLTDVINQQEQEEAIVLEHNSETFAELSSSDQVELSSSVQSLSCSEEHCILEESTKVQAKTSLSKKLLVPIGLGGAAVLGLIGTVAYLFLKYSAERQENSNSPMNQDFKKTNESIPVESNGACSGLEHLWNSFSKKSLAEFIKYLEEADKKEFAKLEQRAEGRGHNILELFFLKEFERFNKMEEGNQVDGPTASYVFFVKCYVFCYVDKDQKYQSFCFNSRETNPYDFTSVMFNQIRQGGLQPGMVLRQFVDRKGIDCRAYDISVNKRKNSLLNLLRSNKFKVGKTFESLSPDTLRHDYASATKDVNAYINEATSFERKKKIYLDFFRFIDFLLCADVDVQTHEK